MLCVWLLALSLGLTLVSKSKEETNFGLTLVKNKSEKETNFGLTLVTNKSEKEEEVEEDPPVYNTEDESACKILNVDCKYCNISCNPANPDNEACRKTHLNSKCCKVKGDYCDGISMTPTTTLSAPTCSVPSCTYCSKTCDEEYKGDELRQCEAQKIDCCGRDKYCKTIDWTAPEPPTTCFPQDCPYCTAQCVIGYGQISADKLDKCIKFKEDCCMKGKACYNSTFEDTNAFGYKCKKGNSYCGQNCFNWYTDDYIIEGSTTSSQACELADIYCCNECPLKSCEYCNTDCGLIEFDSARRHECRSSQKKGCCKIFGCAGPTNYQYHCYAHSCHYCQKDCNALGEFEKEECELFKAKTKGNHFANTPILTEKDGCCSFCGKEPKNLTCTMKSCSDCTNQRMDPKENVVCPFPYEQSCYFNQRECCGKYDFCQDPDLPPLHCTDEDACDYCVKSDDCKVYSPFRQRCVDSKSKCCNEGEHCNNPKPTIMECKNASCDYCRPHYEGLIEYEDYIDKCPYGKLDFCKFSQINCCNLEGQYCSDKIVVDCNKSCEYCHTYCDNLDTNLEVYKCKEAQRICCKKDQYCWRDSKVIHPIDKPFQCDDESCYFCKDWEYWDITDKNHRISCPWYKYEFCRQSHVRCCFESDDVDEGDDDTHCLIKETFTCARSGNCLYCPLKDCNLYADKEIKLYCQLTQEKCCNEGEHCRKPTPIDCLAWSVCEYCDKDCFAINHVSYSIGTIYENEQDRCRQAHIDCCTLGQPCRPLPEPPFTCMDSDACLYCYSDCYWNQDLEIWWNDRENARCLQSQKECCNEGQYCPLGTQVIGPQKINCDTELNICDLCEKSCFTWYHLDEDAFKDFIKCLQTHEQCCGESQACGNNKVEETITTKRTKTKRTTNTTKTTKRTITKGPGGKNEMGEREAEGRKELLRIPWWSMIAIGSVSIIIGIMFGSCLPAPDEELFPQTARD